MFFKNGKPNLMIILGIFIRASIALVAFYNTFLIMKTATTAGASISVIFSLTSLASFMTAGLFFFVYNEKITQKHIIGMSLLVGCVIIIGFSK